MKVIVSIFSSIIIILNTAFIQDKTSKIQQELIETIQKEYVSWLVEKTNEASGANSLPILEHDSTTANETGNNFASTSDVLRKYEFYDFEFKITNSQAVVQFSVGNMMKSAFLEKKDGKWQLICCADLSPLL